MTIVNRPIFIAEVKTKSPFGFQTPYDWNALFDWASMYGDWVSVHTDPRWGGDFSNVTYAKDHLDKPILAKGIHATDDDIQHCLDLGADYVLVVDRIPADKYVDKCLLELPLDKFLEVASLFDTTQKFVINKRNLINGVFKNDVPYDVELAFRKSCCNWLCQASGIKIPNDVNPRADAFIVGENLIEFCESYKLNT